MAEAKMTWEGMSVWSWPWVSRDASEAEEPMRASTEDTATEMSFPVYSVLVCLCATMAVMWLLAVRHATEAEPLELGASVGGTPGWQSWSVWYRMASPLDEWDPLCK